MSVVVKHPRGSSTQAYVDGELFTQNVRGLRPQPGEAIRILGNLIIDGTQTGGAPSSGDTLAQVLVAGNTTSGRDIVLSPGDSLTTVSGSLTETAGVITLDGAATAVTATNNISIDSSSGGVSINALSGTTLLASQIFSVTSLASATVDATGLATFTGDAGTDIGNAGAFTNVAGNGMLLNALPGSGELRGFDLDIVASNLVTISPELEVNGNTVFNGDITVTGQILGAGGDTSTLNEVLVAGNRTGGEHIRFDGLSKLIFQDVRVGNDANKILFLDGDPGGTVLWEIDVNNGGDILINAEFDQIFTSNTGATTFNGNNALFNSPAQFTQPILCGDIDTVTEIRFIAASNATINGDASKLLIRHPTLVEIDPELNLTGGLTANDNSVINGDLTVTGTLFGGGGGGVDTLEQTLVAGNTTNSQNIELTNTSIFNVDATSSIIFNDAGSLIAGRLAENASNFEVLGINEMTVRSQNGSTSIDGFTDVNVDANNNILLTSGNVTNITAPSLTTFVDGYLLNAANTTWAVTGAYTVSTGSTEITSTAGMQFNSGGQLTMDGSSIITTSPGIINTVSTGASVNTTANTKIGLIAPEVEVDADRLLTDGSLPGWSGVTSLRPGSTDIAGRIRDGLPGDRLTFNQPGQPGQVPIVTLTPIETFPDGTNRFLCSWGVSQLNENGFTLEFTVGSDEIPTGTGTERFVSRVDENQTGNFDFLYHVIWIES